MIVRQAEFARRLMRARTKQKLKAVDVIAEMKEAGIPVSRQAYSNWEMGFSLPKRRYIDAMAKVLSVEPGWLHYGDAKEAVGSIRQIKSVLRQAAKDLYSIEQQLKRG